MLFDKRCHAGRFCLLATASCEGGSGGVLQVEVLCRLLAVDESVETPLVMLLIRMEAATGVARCSCSCLITLPSQDQNGSNQIYFM